MHISEIDLVNQTFKALFQHAVPASISDSTIEPKLMNHGESMDAGTAFWNELGEGAAATIGTFSSDRGSLESLLKIC